MGATLKDRIALFTGAASGIGRASVLAFSRVNEYSQVHPIGKIETPEEIAEAAVWLCSSAASFVVGHPMNMDGG